MIDFSTISLNSCTEYLINLLIRISNDLVSLY
nr:MAG TPA: hypothetical protein [Caudoviricetes sp.]